jgi:hypothetical protein
VRTNTASFDAPPASPGAAAAAAAAATAALGNHNQSAVAGATGSAAAPWSAAPSALQPDTWHCVSMYVTPVWGHPVQATAVLITLETAGTALYHFVFKLQIIDGQRIN